MVQQIDIQRYLLAQWEIRENWKLLPRFSTQMNAFKENQHVQICIFLFPVFCDHRREYRCYF